jgi:hypothetical protein
MLPVIYGFREDFHVEGVLLQWAEIWAHTNVYWKLYGVLEVKTAC